MIRIHRNLTVMALVGIAGVANATFTVGTFADPAVGSSQNFFSFVNVGNGNGLLNGGWSVDGLHLLTPGIAAPDQMNVRFEIRDAQNNLGLDTVNLAGIGITEAGYVRFYDSSNTTVLRIDFNSGRLTEMGFIATEFFNQSLVTMSGSIVDGPWTNESFGFSFANWSNVGQTVTMSSAFTSSAVPEPATIAALGLGVAALLRRRRK